MILSYQKPIKDKCKFRGKANCPLHGECLTEAVVYKATNNSVQYSIQIIHLIIRRFIQRKILQLYQIVQTQKILKRNGTIQIYFGNLWENNTT